MNKKVLILVIGAAFVGGLIGSFFRVEPAQANIFSDFYTQYVKPFFPRLAPQQNGWQASSTPFAAPQAPAQPYAPTVDYEAAVVKAVERTSPAVISIVITKDVPILEQCPYNPFGDLPPDIQQFFGQDFQFSQPCQKGIQRQEVGGGSGFIISPDGLIATNKHVVLDERASYTVLTNDGKKYEAKVLARDPVKDIAVIKIEASGLPTVRLGNSDSMKLGQAAIAIGNALGEFRNTVSVGVISGLSRNITASGGGMSERIAGLIQTDAAINQGNSGGPLLNLKGEVIGINVAMVAGAQNIGFALPINQVRHAIESVEKTGRIVTPYLGVRYLLLTADLAKKNKLSVDHGALVRGGQDGPAVVKNSPAEKAGIVAEDVITDVNGEKVTIDASLGDLIQKYSVGDTVTLTLIRSGKEMIVSVRIEERPAAKN